MKIIDGACLVSMQLLILNINILMVQFFTITDEKRVIRLITWHEKPLLSANLRSLEKYNVFCDMSELLMYTLFIINDYL